MFFSKIKTIPLISQKLYIFFKQFSFITSFIILASTQTFSQKSITGKIQNVNGEILPSANISLKINDKIASYAISKSDGSYTLVLPQNSKETIWLSVSKMGFKTKEIKIENTIQKVNFVLEEGEIELKELIVSTPPIRRFGDTLSYRVSEFSSKSDRTIGDIISKLPGIEVDVNGKISYQGKPINRYYIDNLNLLDGRYGLVNNNLAFDKVISVEVFENHQPIRILDSLQLSESAALNIKLKNPVTKTIPIQYATGGKPFLWDVNASPLVFTPNLQFLGSFQSNNSGRNIDLQIKDHFNPEINTTNWLSIPKLKTPPLPGQSWLDNTSHVGSLNILKKNRRDIEIKLNTSLILNKTIQKGNTDIKYLLANETIEFNENVSHQFTENQATGSLQFLKNTSKNYFKNTLTLEKKWSNHLGLNTRQKSDFDQTNTSGNFNLKNSFHKIFKIKQNTLNFYSLTNYTNTSQTLSVKYRNTDSSSSPVQLFSSTGFSTHNFIENTIRASPKIAYNFKAGSQIEVTAIQTELVNHPVDSVNTNNFLWQNIRNYVSSGINYTPKNWLFSATIPLANTTINYKDKDHFTLRRANRWIIEPNIYIRLKTNTKYEYFVNANYLNTLAKLGDLYTGFIMTNYLSVIQKNGDFRNNHTYSLSTGMNFNKLVSGRSFNVSYTYSYNLQNLLAENSILQDGSQKVTYTQKDNTAKMQLVNFRINQYIFPFKTNLEIGMSYANNRIDRFINEYFKTFVQEALSPHLSANYNGLKWLEIYYKTNYTFAENASSKMYQWNHQVALGLHSNKNTSIRFTADQYVLKNQNTNQNYIIGNILLRYTFPKIKHDLELSLNNIFNQREFKDISINDFYIQETTFRLRPRQFMLKGRISI